jgi:hypothetical protein
MKISQNTTQKVILFLDESTVPFAEYSPPVKIDLDTTKLVDGEHSMKIVAKSSNGKEGIQMIHFTVRNGPAISVLGLKNNDTVSDIIPITVNAYGSERSDSFVITASETPKPIPSWVWAGVITFLGWAAYYFITTWGLPI